MAAKPIKPENAYVLVVEDNLQNTVLISRLLDHIGVKHYEWKASGWAIEGVAESMPRVDLVLLDMHLPGEDGYTVLANLRQKSFFAETRVVAVTADASSQTMQKAKQAGFDGFLGKPIDPSNFPGQVEAILRGEAVWHIGHEGLAR